MRLPRRLRSERGQASVELLGFLPLMLVTAALAFQALIFVASITEAENAARSGARASSLGRDPHAAAEASVSSWLRSGLTTRREPHRYVVRIRVPVLFPGLTISILEVTRDAAFPRTDAESG